MFSEKSKIRLHKNSETSNSVFEQNILKKMYKEWVSFFMKNSHAFSHVL